MAAGAHAAGGASLGRGPALIVVSLVCATVGALCASARLDGRHRMPVVTAALAAAQFASHLTFAFAGHHHDGGLGPAMVAAHLLAAVLLGAAISLVEYLCVVGASVLCWLRLFAAATSRPPAFRARRAPDVVVARRELLRCGLATRAPPAPTR